jgi:hypothetical protein
MILIPDRILVSLRHILIISFIILFMQLLKAFSAFSEDLSGGVFGCEGFLDCSSFGIFGVVNEGRYSQSLSTLPLYLGKLDKLQIPSYQFYRGLVSTCP